MEPQLRVAGVAVSAVAFDFFGTLGTWSPGVVSSPTQVLYACAGRSGVDPERLVTLAEGADGTAQFDQPPPPEAFAAWQRSAWQQAAAYAGVEYSDDLDALLHLVVERRSPRLYPDVVPALRTLQRGSVPWILCTNASPDLPRKLRQLLPPELAPAAIVASYRIGARKPHPRMFMAALDALALPTGSVLFLGDRIDCDVIGSCQHGFRPILIDRQARYPVEAATRHGAIAVWRSLIPLTLGGA